MIAKICLVTLLGCAFTQVNSLSLKYRRDAPDSELETGDSVVSATTEERDISNLVVGATTEEISFSEFYENLGLDDEFNSFKNTLAGAVNNSIEVVAGAVKGELSLSEIYNKTGVNNAFETISNAAGGIAKSSYDIVTDGVEKGLNLGASALPASKRVAKKFLYLAANLTEETLKSGEIVIFGAKNMVKETIDSFDHEIKE